MKLTNKVWKVKLHNLAKLKKWLKYGAKMLLQQICVFIDLAVIVSVYRLLFRQISTSDLFVVLLYVFTFVYVYVFIYNLCYTLMCTSLSLYFCIFNTKTSWCTNKYMYCTHTITVKSFTFKLRHVCFNSCIIWYSLVRLIWLCSHKKS